VVVESNGSKVAIVMLGLFLIVVGIPGACYAVPKYNVWERGLSGEAELAKAEYTKKVIVTEAVAKQEAAKALAQAEVERARGVAEANRIIGASLKDNDAYLRYLWIQQLAESPGDVVYVPTEANLPIMEAGRFGRTKQEKKEAPP